MQAALFCTSSKIFLNILAVPDFARKHARISQREMLAQYSLGLAPQECFEECTEAQKAWFPEGDFCAEYQAHTFRWKKVCAVLKNIPVGHHARPSAIWQASSSVWFS